MSPSLRNVQNRRILRQEEDDWGARAAGWDGPCSGERLERGLLLGVTEMFRAARWCGWVRATGVCQVPPNCSP